jgi:signal transduction histidine kinase
LLEKYFKESTSLILEKSKKAKKILQNQIFSQSLTENLINDLLDLAKLENNSFSFNKEYFNLGSSIYEAFQILLSSANQQNIELVAQIDKIENLDYIQSIYGDQGRFKQIFLNFISNSLKFTNKKGKVTVLVKILNS